MSNEQIATAKFEHERSQNKKRLTILRLLLSGMLLGAALASAIADHYGVKEAPVLGSLFGGTVAGIAIKFLHLV